jgi:hypothetical protein
MAKRLTIVVSDEVYDGLHRRVGRGRIGRFLDDLARPHVTEPQPGDPAWENWLAEEYRSAAAAERADPVLARETDAWLGADLGDALPEEDWSALRDEAR